MFAAWPLLLELREYSLDADWMLRSATYKEWADLKRTQKLCISKYFRLTPMCLKTTFCCCSLNKQPIYRFSAWLFTYWRCSRKYKKIWNKRNKQKSLAVCLKKQNYKICRIHWIFRKHFLGKIAFGYKYKIQFKHTNEMLININHALLSKFGAKLKKVFWALGKSI